MSIAAYRRTLTGTQVQDGLTDAARKLGYLVFHDPNSRRTEPGFPDLVIAGHGRLFAWECKSRGEAIRTATVAPRSGRVLPGQDDWLREFCRVAGVAATVVRGEPEHEGELGYDEALAVLRDGRGQP